jgi:hypothetical protein
MSLNACEVCGLGDGVLKNTSHRGGWANLTYRHTLHKTCEKKWFREALQKKTCNLCLGSITVTHVDGMELPHAKTNVRDIEEERSIPVFCADSFPPSSYNHKKTSSYFMNYSSKYPQGCRDFRSQADSCYKSKINKIWAQLKSTKFSRSMNYSQEFSEGCKDFC